MYYTYVHKTDNGEVFYVGKGKARRAWATNKRSLYWQRIVEKYGLKVEVVSYFENEWEAFEQERKLIKSYRSLGVRLVNMTDGGEGASGKVLSLETIEKIRKSNKGKKRSDKAILNNLKARKNWLEVGVKEYWTKERRLQYSKMFSGENHPNYGKKFSLELRKKLSEAHKGKANTVNVTPVICLDTGMSFVSASEAARWVKENGFPKAIGSAISGAAKGKYSQMYGYKWGLAS